MLNRLVAHLVLGASAALGVVEISCVPTMICCHLLQILCSCEFLRDIFWIRLSLFQLCSLLVEARKGTKTPKAQTDPPGSDIPLEVSLPFGDRAWIGLICPMKFASKWALATTHSWRTVCQWLLCKGENVHLFSFPSFGSGRVGTPLGHVPGASDEF